MTDNQIEFEQSFEPTSGVVEIRIRAREIIDEQAIHQIGETLTAFAGKPGVKNLVLDLREVRFLSSRGLSTLISLHRKLTASAASLILLVDRPEILELFGLTHLDQILNIARNEADLTEKFNIVASPKTSSHSLTLLAS